MIEIFSQISMPFGSMDQAYRIIEIVGIENFGIVHSAEDNYFTEVVTLKKNLPSELTHHQKCETRAQQLFTQTGKVYQWARHKFLPEDKILRELEQPDQYSNTVRVSQLIETNCTGYLVMDYVSRSLFLNLVKIVEP
jgi:serine/threonine protein kinase